LLAVVVAINKKIMAKVITFSRQFPKGHPKEGQPTYFVEKLIKGFPKYSGNDFTALKSEPSKDLWALLPIEFEKFTSFNPKYHTIRVGKRFKEGDFFSPRVWLNKPYTSPQVTIAPDIKIVKTIDIGLRIRGDFKEFYCNDEDLTGTSISLIASNDGLELNDFLNWFTKPFDGQIICWRDCGY